jgi:hypothetical protein
MFNNCKFLPFNNCNFLPFYPTPPGRSVMTYSQFQQVVKAESFKPYLDVLGMTMAECEELFVTLNVISDGQLQMEDFLQAASRYGGVAMRRDMIKLLSTLDDGMKKAASLSILINMLHGAMHICNVIIWKYRITLNKRDLHVLKL